MEKEFCCIWSLFTFLPGKKKTHQSCVHGDFICHSPKEGLVQVSFSRWVGQQRRFSCAWHSVEDLWFLCVDFFPLNISIFLKTIFYPLLHLRPSSGWIWAPWRQRLELLNTSHCHLLPVNITQGAYVDTHWGWRARFSSHEVEEWISRTKESE